MGSFYGNVSIGGSGEGGEGSGTAMSVEDIQYLVTQVTNRRIIVSDTEPINQQTGDIWFVLEDN